MTSSAIQKTIQQHARPLAPIATDAKAKLQHLDDIRAVMFDVYGTLFVSGCGEVGTVAKDGRIEALQAAAEHLNIELLQPPHRVIQLHDQCIQRMHQLRRSEGVEYPEVDIVQIWREVLLESADRQPPHSPQQLAVEYEARVNPAWPMPGMVDCLDALSGSGKLLGIISNAQFFTPELFGALVGRTTSELGFADELCIFSYQHGHAKPGLHLYELAQQALTMRGVSPAQVLYVGNDMLNDVMPAAKIGFRTALFAAGARSLRRRQSDDRVAGIPPDLVVTDLTQIPRCLGTPDASTA